ncbi:MAG: PKD domain-containing protein [Deltaproteobacteria bacterium]|nr:PKD domain-containing protein [Deltaproteobacteria bacterium]
MAMAVCAAVVWAEDVSPEANCYVVRLGYLANMPVSGELVGPPQHNAGAYQAAGMTTVIDVFAANRSGDTYYYTDKLPAGGAEVVLTGLATDALMLGEKIVLASAAVTLVDGHARVNELIEDLKIPEIMAATMEGKSAADQMAQMETYLSAGVEITWTVLSGTTRSVAVKSLDDTAAGEVSIVTGYDLLMSGYSGYSVDTSRCKPGQMNIMSLVGLPLNGFNASGEPVEYSMHEPDGRTPGTTPGMVSPLDAYFLISDPTRSQGLITSGKLTQSYVYGAIVAFDKYGNPAPFAQGGSVSFVLSDFVLPCYHDYSLGMNEFSSIVSTYDYQAFLPFGMKAVTETVAENVYIQSAAGTDSALFSAIDSAEEGIDFKLYDTSLKVYSGFNMIRQVAEDDAVLTLVGSDGSGTDQDYLLTVVRGDTGALFMLGEEGALSGASQIIIPRDPGENGAGLDVALFNAFPAETYLFCVIVGQENGMRILKPQLHTGGVEASDAGDYDISSIVVQASRVNVEMDLAQAGYEIHLYPGSYIDSPEMIQVFDRFGNQYGTGNVSMFEDADLAIRVYKANNDGTAAAELYPGAHADVDNDRIEIEFSSASVTNDVFNEAVVVIQNQSGTAAASFLINIDGPVCESREVFDVVPMNCGFTVTILDGTLVTFSETQISVMDSEGNDITALLTFNGPADVSPDTIVVTGLERGTYSVQVAAFDTIGNGPPAVYIINVECANQTTTTTTIPTNPFEIEAAFTGCVSHDETQHQIQFFDESEGDIIAWEWHFGEGDQSYEQFPVHEYQQAGTYTVSLTVTGSDGSTDTVTKNECVRLGDCAVDAAFIANPKLGRYPLKVRFTNQSEGPVTVYAWDFGDGGASDQENPEHTYHTEGVYSVTLTVSGAGCSSTETQTNLIRVEDRRVQPGFVCPVVAALSGRADARMQAHVLRDFRDYLLATSLTGKLLTGLYYASAGDVNAVIEQGDELKADIGDLVTDLAPRVKAVVDGNSTAITQAELSRIKGVLHRLADNGGAVMNVAVNFVLDKIENEAFLQQYGIVLIPEENN